MSLPHIQFSVIDWRKDIGIQSLSYHHRGIWFEILMFMHCSEQRGRLVLGGKPMPDSALARLLGLSEQELTNTISVLTAQGVANRDQNGALINRRMVREEKIKQIRKEAGSKGGSKTDSKREATPFVLLSQTPLPSSPPHTPPLTPHPSTYINKDGALQKVRDFAKSEGISESDADWFFHKCEGNGWTNGGQPIRDWKATLRSWKHGGYLASQRKQSRNSSVALPLIPTWGDRKAQKEMINEVQEQKNEMFKMKQREQRPFTPNEQAKYDELAKRLERLKSV